MNIDELIAEHREKNFAVEVKPSRYAPEETVLSVTTNGKQWNTLSLTTPEIAKVIDELTATEEIMNQDILDKAKALIEIVEGVESVRWAHESNRLKDTKEWAEFYVAVRREPQRESTDGRVKVSDADITEALKSTNGNQSKAARSLGISRKTISRHIANNPAVRPSYR